MIARMYLSGPISSDPLFRDKFNRAQAQLAGMGYRVVNPANMHMVMDNRATWDDYMRIDTELLCMCDVLVQLPGWERSLGCQREYGVAYARDMIILKLEDILNGCTEKG